MDCHSELVLHSLGNNQPVQVVMHQRRQTAFLLHLLHHLLSGYHNVVLPSIKASPTKSHKRAGGEASIGRRVTASERNVDKIRRVIRCESLCQLLEPICRRTVQTGTLGRAVTLQVDRVQQSIAS